MTLGEFLHLHSIPQVDFSRTVGISQSQVNKYVRRGAIPSSAHMVAIREATGGAVTPNDWYLEA